MRAKLRGVVELRGRQRVLRGGGVGDRLQLRAQFWRLVRGELLVGDQPRTSEIDLLGRDQADLVDQPRQHAHV